MESKSSVLRIVPYLSMHVFDTASRKLRDDNLRTTSTCTQHWENKIWGMGILSLRLGSDIKFDYLRHWCSNLNIKFKLLKRAHIMKYEWSCYSALKNVLSDDSRVLSLKTERYGSSSWCRIRFWLTEWSMYDSVPTR